MADPIFFQPAGPFSLEDILRLTGARIVNGVDAGRSVRNVAPLDQAGPADLTFIDNPSYVGQLATTRAAACLCAPKHSAKIPGDVAALEIAKPYDAYVQVLKAFYPQALKPTLFYGAGIAPSATIHPTAKLEPGVTVEPGAVIGADVEIGGGTVIGPGAAIGANVRIGRDCHIAAGVTVSHALIGNRVILHPGVRIGQDGFGYLMGAAGHQRVPQIGRVILQDLVDIGANSTVDRGANRDTIIGEGTKIDNLVQIGHNVVIGRHCVIVSQVGISGSVTLGDFVVLGGQVGVNGHVSIGNGAQVAATSSVKDDVPAGGRFGGTPAEPIKEWYREQLAMKRLARRELQSGRESRPNEGE